ncbi:central kinetochore associated family protein [Schizosaccharomyces japonicus yFS275]|uniref:Central kinetochore associated family protein n=1 Tax=Schizosaccharomyces japonicus (strain yFS275 / FY16936) TaxID=402676 RepID=B6K2L8_SCHJY|nr:central kinetochore associated family protein [Schizosaccharomyces japonicus yFS275]EEB07399.1 central kinetochore associated family protein [Schizosaccharomyces japonicus yFS275]
MKQIKSLRKAVVEGARIARDSKDYITYCTLLDVTLQNGLELDSTESTQLLQVLKEQVLLERNNLIFKEIAWDLISPVILYYEKVEPETVNSLLDVFGQIGNPRELYIRCNELFHELNVDESCTLKVVALVNLSRQALSRIETKNPILFIKPLFESIWRKLEEVICASTNQVKVVEAILDLLDDLVSQWKDNSDCIKLFPSAMALFTCIIFESLNFNLAREYVQQHFNSPKVAFRCQREISDTDDIDLKIVASRVLQLLKIANGLQSWPKIVSITQKMGCFLDEPQITAAEETRFEEDIVDAKLNAYTKGYVAGSVINEYFQDDRSDIPQSIDEVYPVVAQLIQWEGQGWLDLGLFLAMKYLDCNFDGNVTSRTKFFSVLQLFHFVAALNEDATVRLISNEIVLRFLSKVSEEVKITYILDVLHECPFLNVKTEMLRYYQELYCDGQENSMFQETKYVRQVIEACTNIPEQVDGSYAPFFQQCLAFLFVVQTRDNEQLKAQSVQQFIKTMRIVTTTDEDSDDYSILQPMLDKLDQQSMLTDVHQNSKADVRPNSIVE